MSNGNATKKRALKIYYGHHSHSYEPHPVIRLAGLYLSEMDFKIGDKIEVTIEREQIRIVKLPIDKTRSM